MTDSATGQAAESPPISSIDDLADYFRSGETPRADWRIGMEHEKVGVDETTFARVPYEGGRGIAALLERIALADGWERTFEGPNLIALTKSGASIIL